MIWATSASLLMSVLRFFGGGAWEVSVSISFVHVHFASEKVGAKQTLSERA